MLKKTVLKMMIKATPVPCATLFVEVSPENLALMAASIANEIAIPAAPIHSLSRGGWWCYATIPQRRGGLRPTRSLVIGETL